MKPRQKKLLKFGVISIVIGTFFAFLLLANGYARITQITSSRNLTANTMDALAVEAINGTRIKNTEPTYTYFTKDINKKPKVGATAYLVGDLITGEIILEKNENKQFPIASVSKLMTATVASDTLKKDDTISISKKALATEGQNGDFRLNEKVKVGDILYPLLLESSNDAAEAIAMHIDRDNFLAQMNSKAKTLGLKDTSFKDPSGLSPQNISTTKDLFKLASYIANQKPELFKLTNNKSYKNKAHVWFSNNQFLRDAGYLGGKSGYTDEAKQTVVSLFSLPLSPVGARPIAITLLQSPDRHKDVENILKHLQQNVFYGTSADADTGWVNQKLGTEETPESKEPDFVKLAFLGDIMLDRGVKNSVNKNFGGDYSTLFSKLNILKNSDVVFANLEGSASDKGTDMHNLYSFHMNPSVIPALKAGGIDIVSVANNHVGDWGLLSYVDTLKRLKENEIQYTGGGFNLEEAVKPTIVEKYGMKIGYLGFSDVGPNWMGATTESGGLLLANNPKLEEIIGNASKQVDYLIVSFHFGVEYKKIHNARQELLAHKAVDAGAKLVIGTHPHVIEDTEVYKNSLIAYSLGNFIFDQPASKDTMEGMLLEVKLWRDGSMTTKQNTVKLNRVFQPDTVVEGKETKVKFQDKADINQKITQ